MASSEASSSEASSSEAEDHQKLKLIRRCKLKDSKVVQWIQSRLNIAIKWKRGTIANSKGFKKHWMLVPLLSVDKVQLYEVYNHYLHYTEFVSATRQG